VIDLRASGDLRAGSRCSYRIRIVSHEEAPERLDIQMRHLSRRFESLNNPEAALNGMLRFGDGYHVVESASKDGLRHRDYDVVNSVSNRLNTLIT